MNTKTPFFTCLDELYEADMISHAALRFAEMVQLESNAQTAPNSEAGETQGVGCGQVLAALCVQQSMEGHSCLDLSVSLNRIAHDYMVETGKFIDLPDKLESLAALKNWMFQTDKNASLDAEHQTTPKAIVEFVSSEDLPYCQAQTLLSPFVLLDDKLFLRRLFQDETDVAEILSSLCIADSKQNPSRIGSSAVSASETSKVFAASNRGQLDETQLTQLLDDLFGSITGTETDRSRQAATKALKSRLRILTGGPGTGKTYTLARIIALVLTQFPQTKIGLSAPTGKAAKRMDEAIKAAIDGLDSSVLDEACIQSIEQLETSTIHRMLKMGAASSPRYNASNPLPYDLIIVDEVSMISLPLMTDFLAALKPSASLILVGDPHQLASVETGAVLADLVNTKAGLASQQVHLTVNHRSIEAFDALFNAINCGQDDKVISILRNHNNPDQLRWIELSKYKNPNLDAQLKEVLTEQVDIATKFKEKIAAGDKTGWEMLMNKTKLLCATHLGEFGVSGWTNRIEAELFGNHSVAHRYMGQPLMVTSNDYINNLFNGDTAICTGNQIWFPTDNDNDVEVFDPVRLAQLQTWWAMTIHKSQGSEFAHTIVSLGAIESRVHTRELFYTAVTRAKKQLTIIGSEDLIRSSVKNDSRRNSALATQMYYANAKYQQ